jgi:Holliday junction resolvase
MEGRREEMIRFEKVGQTDHYQVRKDKEAVDRYFYIDVVYENGEVTHFIIERLDRYGTKIKLTREEVCTIAELARQLGLVREA